MEMQTLAARLRLRHLACFAAIAREQHLGRAAGELHLTQPAVSKTLAELEELTGLRLFERGRQGAQLTREGLAFLPHAQAVLEALRAASNAVLGVATRPRPVVQIGALPTVAPDLLPAVLTRVRAARPDTRVTVQTAANEPLLNLLRAGKLDFAVGRMADPQQLVGLSFEFLYVEPLVLAVRPGHPLLGRRRLRLAQVLDYPLAVFSRGTIPRQNTESYLSSQGLRLPHNCVETLSVSVARLLTQGSDTVWFAPSGAVREDMAQGALAQLKLPMQGTEEPVGLLTRSEGGLSEAARPFVLALREAAAAREAPAE
jgi:pca operon transcription factor PcaQ